MTETTADIINSLKELIGQCRKTARVCLNNDLAAQLANENLGDYSDILTALQINGQALSGAAKKIRTTATSLLREMSVCENDLSNLEADLRLGNKGEAELTRDARHLQQRCKERMLLHRELLRQQEILTAAQTSVRAHLNLASLLRLAATLPDASRKNKEDITSGMKLFHLVTDDETLMNRELNIHRLEKKFALCDTALRNIAFPKLPQPVLGVLHPYLDICRNTIEETQRYIVFIRNSLGSEMRKIREIEQEICQASDGSLLEALERLRANCRKIHKNIIEFDYKSDILKELQMLPLLQKNLMQFIEMLQGPYLAHLVQETGSSDTALSPHRLAEQTGKLYFNGLKGLFRLLKLLLSPSGPDGAVTEQNLIEKITVALTTCPYYYDGNIDNTKKTSDCIDRLIGHYKKPYPYHDIFRLINNALRAYVEYIEKDFATWKGSGAAPSCHATTNGQTSVPPPIKVNLKRLINKIQVRTVQISALRTRGKTSPC